MAAARRDFETSRAQARISGALEPEMWELRHREAAARSPGERRRRHPRGEAAGGDRETESTSDKVSGEPRVPGCVPMGPGHLGGRERWGPAEMSSEAAGRAALPPG